MHWSTSHQPTRRAGLLALALATLGFGLPVAPATAETAMRHADAPVVVELFTSQSCYSCPPAEAFLRTLADREGVLALEWHVDYWNTLVYGSHGKWRDPFSKPAFTQRQRAYNQALRGTGAVYTPQMVIGGAVEAVGSSKADIDVAIADQANRQEAVHVAFTVADGQSRIALEPAAQDGDVEAIVLLVRFWRSREVAVPRGENHGKTLRHRNVVTGVSQLGTWKGGTQRISGPLPTLRDGQDCAVLVQHAHTGRILGATRCPVIPAAS